MEQHKPLRPKRRSRILCMVVLFFAFQRSWAADPSWDGPARASNWVSSRSDSRLKIAFESRGRYERKTGQDFKDASVGAALYRNRLSLSIQITGWMNISGAVQDSRAPGYSSNAPVTVRDSADLLEGYLELFPNQKRGFGMTAGRMTLAYGETRLIASSQWGNVIRGFDNVRMYWRSGAARLEALWLSPVKPRLGEFNRPMLGERLWGTYSSLPGLIRKSVLDFYALRHEQNAPCGFTGGNPLEGTNRLGVTTYGGRFAGPLPRGLSYSLELALQTGRVGPAKHRGAAWFSSLSHRWTISGKTLDLTGEYKYASGTRDPQDRSRVGTFDALFPSTHDKFGHMDLFGWRNIHTARSIATLGITRTFALNLMYDSWWLASTRDALYSASGKAIVRSAAGTAGRHVGQETDLFATYKIQRFTFGAGYGRMFKGEFIRSTTPGVEPTYVYVFHTYSL